jgi:hypothetical protein
MTDADQGPDRIARVLDPAFCQDLQDLSTEELRRRRDETLAERDYLSYLRRLIQTRQDLLTYERSRRTAGADPKPLMDRLIAVLAEGPQGGSRGEALRLQIRPEDIERAEARMAQTLGGLNLAEPVALSDEELERALTLLEETERAVSGDRKAVFRVHDQLQEELKRRYRTDPSAIPVSL